MCVCVCVCVCVPVGLRKNTKPVIIAVPTKISTPKPPNNP